MQKKTIIVGPLLIGIVALSLLSGCASVPEKKYYILNYVPAPLASRISPQPFPCTIRLKDFEIEEAYSRPQMVYRQNPYELQYYYFQVWAVKPTRMITDLVQKHLLTANIVSHIVRRFDEGQQPDYELSGRIEAIEEYDSDQLWFAHLAMRLTLTRTRDNAIVYTRRFDNRKRVYQNQPEYVIREMSA
ncbi:MAG: ABC-type transport auxiliary lipoprotein family protein, partial [Chitinivibrionales bacterium]|nr:ABC-type transport auxiliary lipoprotein family protein [Chitinivibrionales bacterium]